LLGGNIGYSLRTTDKAFLEKERQIITAIRPGVLSTFMAQNRFAFVACSGLLHFQSVCFKRRKRNKYVASLPTSRKIFSLQKTGPLG
jgi:hypothetical protein